MAIAEITQRKSLALRRESIPPFIVTEYGWYMNGKHLSAVLFLDKTDKDWGFAILGADPKGAHRWIDGEHSFKTKSKAVQRLFAMLTKYEKSGETVWEQD